MQDLVQTGIEVAFRYLLGERSPMDLPKEIKKQNILYVENFDELREFGDFFCIKKSFPEQHLEVTQCIASCVFSYLEDHAGEARETLSNLAKQKQNSGVYKKTEEFFRYFYDDLHKNIEEYKKREEDPLVSFNDNDDGISMKELMEDRQKEHDAMEEFLNGWPIPEQMDEHYLELEEMAKQIDGQSIRL